MDHLDAVITLETVIIVKESATIVTIARKREREREVKPQQPAVCNVLASISVGTELSLLSIKGIGSFNDVIFEGFANGVALFSALARNNNDKDNKDDNKDDKHRQRNTFNGILRVCPTDIVAIAI